MLSVLMVGNEAKNTHAAIANLASASASNTEREGLNSQLLWR